MCCAGDKAAEDGRLCPAALNVQDAAEGASAGSPRPGSCSASSTSFMAPINAFAQDNVKRRIACSSVSHHGLVLLGIGRSTASA